MNRDPFGVLGLPARPDLTDDEVRAAWRRIATATHPDRADGGDARRFAEASAAYTELRTRSGRGEAYAGLPAGPRRRSRAGAQTAPPAAPRERAHPGETAHPGRAGHPSEPVRPGRAPATALLSRVRGGRPAVLGLRLAIAAAVIALAFAVGGAQPAAGGLATGAVTWFLLTARHDLAHQSTGERRAGYSVPPSRKSRKLRPLSIPIRGSLLDVRSGGGCQSVVAVGNGWGEADRMVRRSRTVT